MDGLLIIDKPIGPTSHDVVARMRRALRERRIGHTGTLDPAASGVLPLVLGRATRLARFLSASDKSYDVVIRLGVATDSGDAEGAAIGERYAGAMPAADAIDRALDAFRGTFLQQPPALSAKKISGQRSYALARVRDGRREGREGPALPAPVSVTAALEIIGARGDAVTLRVDCSAGFYVRALAHDLGVALGIGAHVEALRRTGSGDLTLRDAIPLVEAEQHPDRAAAAVIPLSRMLPGLPAVVLSTQGVRHAIHGRNIGPADLEVGAPRRLSGAIPHGAGPVRLMDAAGELVGIAEPARAHGLLHPAVVLM